MQIIQYLASPLKQQDSETRGPLFPELSRSRAAATHFRPNTLHFAPVPTTAYFLPTVRPTLLAFIITLALLFFLLISELTGTHLN